MNSKETIEANTEDQFLWEEKYRPNRISECILTPKLEKAMKSFIRNGEIPHLLFYGPPGTGKTTCALAICNELGLEKIFINGSKDSGIDVLRNQISNFASSFSINGKPKIVILDEADYLNASSFQPALRGLTKEFHSNCRFIMTCNYKNRIIDPLHSRFTSFNFGDFAGSRKEVSMAILKRMEEILTKEKIKFNILALAGLINKNYPDWRKVINQCQQYSSGGIIDAGVMIELEEDNFNSLISSLKEKNFDKIRKWVGVNSSIEAPVVIRQIYDQISNRINSASSPSIVIILAEYLDKHTRAIDHEITLTACLIEIAGVAEWL